MARSSRFNLLTDGVEEVADYVKRGMERGGLFMVLATDSGAVRMVNLHHSRTEPRSAAEIVGTYTRAVRIEQIEDDLLARVREIHANRKAAA